MCIIDLIFAHVCIFDGFMHTCASEATCTHVHTRSDAGRRFLFVLSFGRSLTSELAPVGEPTLVGIERRRRRGGLLHHLAGRVAVTLRMNGKRPINDLLDSGAFERRICAGRPCARSGAGRPSSYTMSRPAMLKQMYTCASQREGVCTHVHNPVLTCTHVHQRGEPYAHMCIIRCKFAHVCIFRTFMHTCASMPLAHMCISGLMLDENFSQRDIWKAARAATFRNGMSAGTPDCPDGSGLLSRDLPHSAQYGLRSRSYAGVCPFG